MSRPSRPRFLRRETAEVANVERPFWVEAGAANELEYVHPPIDKRILRLRFFLFNRLSCLRHP
jgi:hypothetical protein